MPQYFFEGDSQVNPDKLSSLEKSVNKPLFAMIVPFQNLPAEFEALADPDLTDYVMVHELFHGQQHSYNTYSPFQMKCLIYVIKKRAMPVEFRQAVLTLENGLRRYLLSSRTGSLYTVMRKKHQ